eukprot:9117736-Karenia_brevis.AAC.1
MKIQSGRPKILPSALALLPNMSAQASPMHENSQQAGQSMQTRMPSTCSQTSNIDPPPGHRPD